MSDDARRLHALWLGQDDNTDGFDVIISVGAVANMFEIPRDAVKQVRRFLDGDCVLCGMTRGERGRATAMTATAIARTSARATSPSTVLARKLLHNLRPWVCFALGV